MKSSRLGIALAVLCVAAGLDAAVLNWKGATTGEWGEAANWVEGTAPTNGGEEVYITNSGSRVILTNSTPVLGSLTIGGLSAYTNVLLFTNWDTCLTATSITIRALGNLTHSDCNTNASLLNTNRVYLVCTNLALNAGGHINVYAQGFPVYMGPGAGTTLVGSGGGHGGAGGDTGGANTDISGPTYDSAVAPNMPGSGGGANNGGAGGGVVRIDAGSLTLDGTINADGGYGPVANYCGGGAGGSVYITCGTFGGSSSGLVSVIGGRGRNGAAGYGGAGGGGRIAVIYTNLAADTAVRFNASGGWGSSPYTGGVGTIYFPDTALLGENMNCVLSGNIIIPNWYVWNVGNLLLTNGFVALGDGGFTLNVATDLTVRGGNAGLHIGQYMSQANTDTVWVGRNLLIDGGALTIGTTGQETRTTLTVGNSLALTNGGDLHVYSGLTNGSSDYGGLVTVSGATAIAANSWVYPYCNPTNGGAVLFRLAAVNIDAGGGFNADSTNRAFVSTFYYNICRGFDATNGPGRGSSLQGSGGGHGGTGGVTTATAGGVTNDVIFAPQLPGSGGGRYATPRFDIGGPGGGVVRIEAASIDLNGVITANGANMIYGYWGGGGAGGSIYILTDAFSGGVDGLLRAAGGDGNDGTGGKMPGSGGGGRIAVWIKIPASERSRILQGNLQFIDVTNSYASFAGTLNVTNGIANGVDLTNGSPGTAFFLVYNNPRGTFFLME